MKFTIDIDLPEDVLREWEPVAFRVPTDVDYFINASGEVTGIGSHCNPRIILRRRFKWPAWLKCRYLVWDADGTVAGCNALPERTDSGWIVMLAEGMEVSASTYIAKEIGLGFPGGDWRTRVEINPT